MSTFFSRFVRFAVPLLLCSQLSVALADPLPGEQMVFQQQPMVQLQLFSPTPYFGHDELSTAVQLPLGAPFDVYTGSFMADDFAVKSGQPITHVRWWGSYLDNAVGPGAQSFFLTFESDVPQGPNNPFSHPGQALTSQIVRRAPLAPGSGSFTEQLIHPGGVPLNEGLYQYNAELATPFVPQPNTVYWLKVVALSGPGPNGGPLFRWGWHNRDYTLEDKLAPKAPAVVPGETGIFSPIPEIPPIWHFQDDAVTGDVRITDLLFPSPNQFTVEQSGFVPQFYRAELDGPSFIAQYSKDLAFELYAIPEPSSFTLALIAMGIMLGIVKSGRQSM